METRKKRTIRQKILNVRICMIYRCTNPSFIYYKEYGGRGIKVCDEWLNNKESFYQWAMNNGYKEGLQIDRIDNNGNYEPSNCRWTTREQNNKNKRNNRYYTINGETHLMSEWCNLYNISFSMVRYRVDYLHWDIYRALTEQPHKVVKTATMNGITKPIYQWADEAGIARNTLRYRLKQGYSIEEALKKEDFVTNGNMIKRRMLLKEENKDPE